MKKIIVFFIVGLVFHGSAFAATTTTVKVTRIAETATTIADELDVPYEDVFAAAIHALMDNDVQILENDIAAGRLAGSKGPGSDEKITFIFTRLDANHTRIEVVLSEGVIAPTVRGWGDDILDDIRQKLNRSPHWQKVAL